MTPSFPHTGRAYKRFFHKGFSKCFHTFPRQLMRLQVLILSRHFFSGTWFYFFIRFTKALLYNTLFSFVGESLNVSMFVNTLVIFSYRVKGNPQVIFSSSQLDDIVTFVLAPIIEKSITFVLSVIS